MKFFIVILLCFAGALCSSEVPVDFQYILGFSVGTLISCIIWSWD